MAETLASSSTVAMTIRNQGAPSGDAYAGPTQAQINAIIKEELERSLRGRGFGFSAISVT